MTKAIETFRQHIDRKAANYLEEIDFDAVTTIEQLVKEGMSPDDIRKLVTDTCGAYGGDYADLVRSTARHVKQRA